MLRTRMRTNWGWSDACILNVSSRGLMINAGAAQALTDGRIEIWHGEHVIIASVVWRKGTRAGLQCEERVPVDDILLLSRAPSLQLTAGQWPSVERRKRPRSPDDNRIRARAIEFAGVAIITVSFAAGALVMAEHAFARPLGYVEAALGS